LPQDKVYIDRLEYELSVIKQKGYAGYFLVVGDLLKFAHENGILTNIRGSVAGSLTTYLLKITNVDPLVYKLPFERFLNPQRPSLPDIDMDYADNRRLEVIAYAKRKYGEDRVAQIGTFGTMMAKGSVRDVARALGYPYATGDKISSLIPLGSQGFPMTIDHAIDIVPELKELYKKDPDTKKIIDLAKKMEGCVRHVSVHAAGVVIAPSPLTDFVPVQLDPKGGDIITQYDMHYVEEVGLPKFDFLGIRNLSILADAISLVKTIHKIDIDIDKIPLDDPKTFEMLSRGETMGLFQLNGSGMTSYLKQLRPSTIFDINAMVALYRPGPLEMIPEYIARKHDNSKIKYLDPRMKSILDQSFGVITYQDDVMMISIELAGYSWLEADKLRKAMGKKIPKEMEEQKEKLLTGFKEHGLNEKKANELWKLIEPFAAYGFNKAHAASYGRVAYQTAYMKANYPVEYMCAILTAESGDVDKISEIIEESKRMGITVLPPDVNASFGGFTVVNGSNHETNRTIRFGLYTIKNLGTDIADSIISERKNNSVYKNLEDFLTRTNHKNFNKKSYEALVKCGAMDSFGERGKLLANTENVLEFNKKIHKIEAPVGPSLFGEAFMKQNSGLNLKEADPMAKFVMLQNEKDLLGLYVTGHPLDNYREKIEKLGKSIISIKEDGKQNDIVICAGIITDIRDVYTKAGDHMAIVKMADFTGTIELAVFPRTYKDVSDILVKENCIAIKGKVNIRNDEKSIALESIKILTE
jgi:DNA polymerase-3 subunit alpha